MDRIVSPGMKTSILKKNFSMMTYTHLMAEMAVGIMIWILKKGIRSNSVLVT